MTRKTTKAKPRQKRMTIKLDTSLAVKAVNDFLSKLPPKLRDQISETLDPLPEFAKEPSPDIGKRLTELNGTRHNSGKPRISLVLEARTAVEGAADILGDGLGEYGRGNWRKGLMRTELIDSLSRHLAAYAAGQDRDPKTGKLHVDYITCNALFMAEMHRTHPHLDDRTVIDGIVVGNTTPQK